MHWDALLSGACGAVLGLAGGFVLATSCVQSSGPPSGVDANGAPASTAVLAELRAIRELLAAGVEDLGSPIVAPVKTAERHGPPEGGAAPLESDELVDALLSLELAVRSTSASSAGTSSPVGLRATAEGIGTPRTADLGALRAARSSMDGELQQVVPDLFGLAPAQVYERFGTPAWVGNSPGRVRWMYEDPDYPGHLVVTFLDGYVGWLHVTRE